MFKVTIKGLLGHKVRVLLTSAVVVVGVAFMAGTLVLTDTVTNTFNDLFGSIYKHTDAVVRSSQKVDGRGGDEQRALLPASLVATVGGVDGVRDAVGNVSGYAQFVGKDGKAIGNPGQGAPTFGFNWNRVPQLNPYTLVAGNPPAGAEQVVADKLSADKGGYSLGDKVKVLTKTGAQEFTLVGIVKFGDADSALGASTAFFDTPTAQKLVGTPDQFNSIGVVAADGLSQTELVDRISKVLPAGDEALTGEAYTKETQDQLAQGLGFFNTFMLAFALIALFVGSFIIYNTFSIIVAQRTKELALLRALGASRAQVRRSVRIEAIVTGILASALGLVGGVFFSIALKGLLKAIGFDLPATGVVVTPKAMLVAFSTGVVITVIAATFPGRKAAKVPPLAAMRDVAIDRTNASLPRVISGIAVTALGVGALFTGLFADVGNRAAMVGLGAAITFLGIAVLGPVFARPLASSLGAPVASIKGITGRLARQNSVRNPKRTSATASALMVGVGLVGALTVMSASAKASIDDVLDKNFTGDFVIDTGSFGGGGGLGISPELASKVRQIPQLGAVSEGRFGMFEFLGKAEPLFGADGDFTKIVDVGTKSGSFADLQQPGTIAVADKLAVEKGWHIGEVIPAKFARTGDKQLRLAATYDRADILGDHMIGLPTYEANFQDQLDFGIYTKLAPCASATEARAAIEKAAADYPTAKVQDVTEYKRAQTQPIDQLFALMYTLLLLAIIIALAGIAITLMLSVHERTREIGLMRAVGMSRSQVRSTVRWESTIIALFGTGLGVAIGIFFGWSIIRALNDQGFTSFVVPFGQLIFLVVLAGLFGILFATWPAYRASKLDVLDALATQ